MYLSRDFCEKSFEVKAGLKTHLLFVFLDYNQEEKKIPREKHDMRLDYIITENEVLSNVN